MTRSAYGIARRSLLARALELRARNGSLDLIRLDNVRQDMADLRAKRAATSDIHARTSAAFLADAKARCDAAAAQPVEPGAADAALAALSAALDAAMAPQQAQQQQANAGAPSPVEPVTFPQFGRFVCNGDSVSLDVEGFTIIATVHHDDCADAPWDSCDGHGPVSDWVRRDKEPGERILSSNGSHHRFYDVAEAMRIAKRDSWGPCIPYRTPGIAAAAAVEADFAVLKAWCDDEWAYCGIVLTVEREGVELVGGFAHALWGVEYNFPESDNGYLSDVAGQLLDAALDDARSVLARLAA